MREEPFPFSTILTHLQTISNKAPKGLPMSRRDEQRPVYLYADRRVYAKFKAHCYRKDVTVTDGLEAAMVFWMRYSQIVMRASHSRDPEKLKQIEADIVELEILERALADENRVSMRKMPISNRKSRKLDA